MIKSTLLGSVLAVALSAGPATAADFHALARLQGAAPAPLQDGVLATTEGGAACTEGGFGSTVDTGTAGGVALCSGIVASTGGAATIAVANELPIAAAQFLAVAF
jgi:hypothetical protein